ncbi:alpha/beta hydrolase [Nocardioides jishulii]|uniref:Alpha/beta hydrolase n=1 Tax=Nocardioides jishulii TaxID=2575440 RepID=A0A4V5TKI1_9ACTN|nr:alpha/beta hydrolase [Nocardioides jishulii]QCX27516.1 alpha/beta hydrolase [Nocardioides jishulii]TKI62323.1 alpha/beta hydrolase [Nocardioides jishulii]
MPHRADTEAARDGASPVVGPAVEDVLGAPYTSETIELGSDDEGEVVATLVKRPTHGETNCAVLHVHGFADYFFHTELAEWWTDRGYTFYALDLRKYGRSIRPHQTPSYIDDLTDYYPELDTALRLITERDGHEVVVGSAHSTGGLILPLWAKDQGADLAGLVLNSPWFDLRGPWMFRSLGTRVINRVAERRPRRMIPRSVNGFYVRSLHRDYDGEWDFNLDWKPLRSWPVYAGWLSAVRRGHARLHSGLGLRMPTLVLASDRTTLPMEMNEDLFTSDVVLDVEQIRRWAPSVARHVTSVVVEGAIHDVVLSRPEARGVAYDEMGRWLRAYVEDGSADEVETHPVTAQLPA